MRKRREDRRVQRTRQAIQQAFVEVLHEKSKKLTNFRQYEKCFEATSVQEITERANVNRGTFYLHFTDKYMLVDAVVRDRFHQQLVVALPPDPRWDRRTLWQLIQAVLNIFEEKYRHQQQPLLALAPMIEQTVSKELTALLLTWLKEANSEEKRSNEALEMVARVVGWAIFGTAIQWSQEEKSMSAEQIADVISQVIMDGVARLAPDALPE